MSRVEVQKVAESDDKTLPVFAEFEKMADRIRLVAYRLFSHRGAADGHALDDWLAAEREVCWPAAELAESDDGYALKVALAGFAPADVAVTATPGEILIQAAHKDERTGGAGESELKWTEFRSNDVLRRIELQHAIDVAGVAANLRNGMLEITAPKAKARPGTRTRAKGMGKGGARAARKVELTTRA